MTDFKDTMKNELDALLTAQEKGEAVHKKKSGKGVTVYTCNPDGLDMVIYRSVNGKCTKEMHIYLSQQDSDENGIIFIKTVKGGIREIADRDGVARFLQDLSGELKTGSNVIPTVKSGKTFADQLLLLKEKKYVELMKEGLLNSDLLSEDKTAPWYVNKGYNYRGESYGVSDRHAKLIRHAVEKISEIDHISYCEALNQTCGGKHGYCYEKGKYKCVWAFSMLADIFDEPFATKCFDEYIDNHRMGDLSAEGLRGFFNTLIDTKENDYGYRPYLGWDGIVKSYRNGDCIAVLDKNRFWEYLQQAVGVGMGKRLDGYLNLYSDYLRQSKFCDGKIKDKYPTYLQVAHDIYSEKYTLIKEFRENERLKSMTEKGQKLIDQTHGKYQLKTLMTVNDFLEEARQNCNCVASYVDNVKTGKCWIASFRPIGSDTTQLTIEINPKGEMVQIKGKFNRNPKDDEMKLLEDFRKTIFDRMRKLKEEKPRTE